MADPADDWIERALQGDESAIAQLLASVQDRVFGLAMRMLGDPADAEDASQEILLSAITNLASFRRQSRFSTWVFRIAVNHLRRARDRKLRFVDHAAVIDEGIGQMDADTAVDRVLAEELRIACTQAMLLCLDREHRLAFVLGAILELDHNEAAHVLEITPAAFRKRLQRARDDVLAFMRRRCGVFDAANPCRCALQVPYARRTGMLDPDRLRFADRPVRGPPRHRVALEELEGLLDVAAVMHTQPDYAAPDLADRLHGLIRPDP